MFGGGFKTAKCKTLLRLAMARIKLLRNKRDVVVKQMRKDIAQLLSTGQDPSARIRVEHIAREQNIIAAYDLLELFCELIIVRLPIIESHKTCPMDLREAICSLIFASPRCADLPELVQIRGVFSAKYGKEFAAGAMELRPECGVNRRVVEKLSVRAPSGETKMKLLTEIAAEYHVNWDPAASLAELLKQPEDLLDGPSKFFGPSQTPISEPQPSNSDSKLSDSSSESRSGSVRQRTPIKLGNPFTPKPIPPARTTRRPVAAQVSPSDSEDEGESNYRPSTRPTQERGTPPSNRALPSQKVQSPSAAAARESGLNRTNSSSGNYESSRRLPGGDPHARPGNDTNTDARSNPESRAKYENVTAAATAAAESANRAVAAARAAAHLARTHPFEKEQPPADLPRRPPPPTFDRYQSSSSDDEGGDQTTTHSNGSKNSSSITTGRSHHHQPLPEKNATYVTSDSYFRNNASHRYK